MGFNISGLAINKSYKNDIETLQLLLGWKLEKRAKIDFETASANWTEEDICNVYFSDNATLIFISMDRCTDAFKVKDADILTFALSETSMAFNLYYYENEEEKRAIMEIEGERVVDDGEALKVENKSEDTSDVIWNQIEELLGKSFWSIEPDEQAEQYTFV